MLKSWVNIFPTVSSRYSLQRKHVHAHLIVNECTQKVVMQLSLSWLWACVVQPCEYFSDEAEHLEEALYSSHLWDELPCGQAQNCHSSIKTMTSQTKINSLTWGSKKKKKNTIQKGDRTASSLLMEIKNDYGFFLPHPLFPKSIIIIYLLAVS